MDENERINRENERISRIDRLTCELYDTNVALDEILDNYYQDELPKTFLIVVQHLRDVISELEALDEQWGSGGDQDD